MRANLDQITTSLERLRSGGLSAAPTVTISAVRSCWRWRRVFAARNMPPAARGPGNFIDNLFGNNSSSLPPPSADLAAPSGTFRTVCVRTCDGAYFPVSFATVQARFQDDERTCKALCPATEATLFAYRNPGEDINQAVSLNGQNYSALPNAFKFPYRVQPVLRLQGRRPDLVRGVEIGRRQGLGRTARRHHRHRGKREANAAACAAEGPDAATVHRQEGRSTRRPRRRHTAAMFGSR